MVLKGEAKLRNEDRHRLGYMREYMRRRRGVNSGVNNLPAKKDSTEPHDIWYDADGNPVYEETG